MLTKKNDQLCRTGNVGFVGENFHRNPMVWSVARRLRRKKLGDAPPWSGPPKTKTLPKRLEKNANPLGRSCSVFSFSWVYSNLLLLLYQHWLTNESDADIWGSGTGWEGHFHRSGTQLGIQVPWCWFVGCSLKKLCMDKSIIHSWISNCWCPQALHFHSENWRRAVMRKYPKHLPRQTLGAFSFTRLHRNRYCNISVLYVKFV